MIRHNVFQHRTLVDLLRKQATDVPSKRAYTYLRDGEQDAWIWDYGELDRRARAVAAWLQSGGAAFAVSVGDEEQLVVGQEVELRAQSLDHQIVATAIRQAVAQGHEVSIFAVVLIKAGSLPKTSSGKVQRSLCRARFLAHELMVITESVLPDGYGAILDDNAIATEAGTNKVEQVTPWWETTGDIVKSCGLG